jgi:hypothetical protein
MFLFDIGILTNNAIANKVFRTQKVTFAYENAKISKRQENDSITHT